jgi:1,4-dihydroxy-2-naphthoate octaprenyltransferase
MDKADSDVANRKFTISVNLGEELGTQIYSIAQANNIAVTVLLRLLLRKALASSVGASLDVALEVVPLGHEKSILQATFE